MLSSRRRLFTHAGHCLAMGQCVIRRAAVFTLPLVVGACTLLTDGSSELPERLSETAAEIEAEDAEFPNLASVPGEPPVVSGSEEREGIREGLVADRANAEYTTESLLPGGATANLENSLTPGSHSIPAESGAEPLASLEQETASAESASLGNDVPPPPEPASDTVAGGSVPPEVEPPPEVAEIPPSPASELLEPVAPPADSSASAPASSLADETLPPEPPVAEAPVAELGADSAPSAAEPDPATELVEPEAKIAALPPGEDLDAGTQILFGEGSADLSMTAQSELSAVADQLLQNEDARIQLLAYASGEENAANQARRLSLARAVAVRRFLIDQGVPSTRMDVRALGNQAEEEPADRVDIVVADR
ncbi:OmpA family protein [Rhodospirillaceae bacterium SYSU D60014]|uniref:OmpA family protein n=1 Tax=Virgifigura deserti TaxID=2268457 RepID=UPI000E666653